MFVWDGPQGSGAQAIVDNYIITVTPNPVSPARIVVPSSPLNVTLHYNNIYTATVTAVNCAGESQTFALKNIEYGKFETLCWSNPHVSFNVVNCGDPVPPINGMLGDYPHTREGITATFQCNESYVPSIIRTAICTDQRLWIPVPEVHICTLVEGMYITYHVILMMIAWLYNNKQHLSL